MASGEILELVGESWEAVARRRRVHFDFSKFVVHYHEVPTMRPWPKYARRSGNRGLGLLRLVAPHPRKVPRTRGVLASLNDAPCPRPPRNFVSLAAVRLRELGVRTRPRGAFRPLSALLSFTAEEHQ